MGSLEDDMCRKDLLEEYREMSERIPESKIYFFEKGGHPAIGTNAENAAKIIIDYINEQREKPLELVCFRKITIHSE